MRFLWSLTPLLIVGFISCSKGSSGGSSVTSNLSVANVTQARDSNSSIVRFVIAVTPVNPQPVTVKYTTREGTAKANTDFTPVSGTLNIPANTAQAEIDVSITGKKTNGGSQEFYLVLSEPSNAVVQGLYATATLQNATSATGTLVWSDEFNGTSLNTNDWNYETGNNGGWGNNELEYYTSGTNNAYVQDGSLVIEAKKEDKEGSNYTSARLTTNGKKSFTYGRMDIRAKVPSGKGIWPALWMLGQNITTINWPSCGEIDIMENISEASPAKTYGTGHWGVSSSNHLYMGGNKALSSGLFSDDYHVYSLNWTADKIEWLLDNEKFYELDKSQVTGGNFPFDKPFFFIMNVAVGGDWPGNPTDATTFPQKMYVDYVRVYQN